MKQKFRQLGTKVSPHETSAKPTESNFYIISYCMMTKRLYILIVGLAMNVVAFAQSSLLPYKNPVLSVDERVKDLLSRMTLEEKVGQLLCTIVFSSNDSNIQFPPVLPPRKGVHIL